MQISIFYVTDDGSSIIDIATAEIIKPKVLLVILWKILSTLISVVNKCGQKLFAFVNWKGSSYGYIFVMEF